jgi:hypothetical protein
MPSAPELLTPIRKVTFAAAIAPPDLRGVAISRPPSSNSKGRSTAGTRTPELVGRVGFETDQKEGIDGSHETSPQIVEQHIARYASPPRKKTSLPHPSLAGVPHSLPVSPQRPQSSLRSAPVSPQPQHPSELVHTAPRLSGQLFIPVGPFAVSNSLAGINFYTSKQSSAEN